MVSQYLLLILVVLLIYTASAEPAFAQSAAGQKAVFAEQVKQNIQRLGVGQEAHVGVRLRGGKMLLGYVSQVGADSFTLIERKTNALVTVQYAEVKQIAGLNRVMGIHFDIPESKTVKLRRSIAKGVGIGLGILSMVGLITAF